MSATLIWRGDAIRDLQTIYDRYEAFVQRDRERFLSELYEQVSFVGDQPNANPKWWAHYRKITLVLDRGVM